MNYGRLVVFFIVLAAASSTAWAQLAIVPPTDKTILKPIALPSFSSSVMDLGIHSKSSPAKPSFLDLRQAFQLTTVQLPNYQVKDLAFFCRLEVRLESATRIPVRFRLGDVQYVDHLEGKIDGVLLGY